MSFAISCFAERFAGATGTRLLMGDLGEARASGRDWCNLGGGDPTAIPAVQAAFRDALAAQLADGSFDSVAANSACRSAGVRRFGHRAPRDRSAARGHRRSAAGT